MKPLHYVTAALAVALIAAILIDLRPSAAGSTSHAAPSPAEPLTSDGSEPQTKATLLELRRTGPKVVTARLKLSVDRLAAGAWRPDLSTEDGTWYSADGLRLLDEVNGRELFPLTDSEGECLCSTDIDEVAPGQSTFVSAKFPAPPAGVEAVSLHVPGFQSFDGIPLGS